MLAVALGARLGWVAATPHFIPTHDAHDFDRYGISIARFGRLPLNGHGALARPIAYRPPGYPFFLAGIYKLVGLEHRVLAARLVQAFTGTLAVGLVGAIGWLLWAPVAGLVAAAIAALYPPLVFVSESMYAEALFVPVSLAAVAAALMFRRSPHPWRWAAATGVLCGVAVLVRANAVVLLLPLVLLLWGARRPARARAGPVAVALACALLVVAPWTIRNALVLHHFVPVTTELGNTMAGTYNNESRLSPRRPAAWTEPRDTREYSGYFQRRSLGDATLDDELRSAAVHYIEKHPGYLAQVLRWNTLRLFNLTGLAEARIGGDTIGTGPAASEVGAVAFWLLALAALCGAFTRAARRVPKAFWLLPLVWYLSVVFLNAEPPRFRIAMDPYFMLLAAVTAL